MVGVPVPQSPHASARGPRPSTEVVGDNGTLVTPGLSGDGVEGAAAAALSVARGTGGGALGRTGRSMKAFGLIGATRFDARSRISGSSMGGSVSAGAASAAAWYRRHM